MTTIYYLFSLIAAYTVWRTFNLVEKHMNFKYEQHVAVREAKMAEIRNIVQMFGAFIEYCKIVVNAYSSPPQPLPRPIRLNPDNVANFRFNPANADNVGTFYWRPGGNTGNVDGGGGNVDGNAGNVDGNTGNVDGGAGNVDGNTGNVDTGAGNVDGNAGNVEIGSDSDSDNDSMPPLEEVM